jgi:predicted LPLAT superfamily acyltransferase
MASYRVVREIVTVGPDSVLALRIKLDGKVWATLVSDKVATNDLSVAEFAMNVLGIGYSISPSGEIKMHKNENVPEESGAV